MTLRILLCVAAALVAPELGGQSAITQWRVYMKVSPCAENRMTDWVTVADRDPTPNGPNHYIMFPESHVHATMAAAMAEAASLKVAACTFGTGGATGCPKYESYCCHKYQVYQHQQTKAFSVIPNSHDNAGYGWMQIKSGLCCEAAFELAGMSPVCGGGQGCSQEGGSNRPGYDYTSFWQTQDYWTECQQACNADARCKAYTYVRAGAQGSRAQCWLKSAVPPARPDNCCVSGVKAAPPPLTHVTGNPPGHVRPPGAVMDPPVVNRPPVVTTPRPPVTATPVNPPGRVPNPGERPCNAGEQSAFSRMTGSWKSAGPKITIGGSCERASGTFDYAEYCENPDATYNRTLARYHGTFTGRMSGSSLSLNWNRSGSSVHPAASGTGSCSVSGDGSLSCSGVGCQISAKRQ